MRPYQAINVLMWMNAWMVSAMKSPIAPTEKALIGAVCALIRQQLYCTACTLVGPKFTRKLSCQCLPGFLGDGMICEDNDECQKRQHDCHHYGRCTNNDGSFSKG